MAERVNLGGVTNTVMHLETDGAIHIEEKQDCQGILDYTKAARNNRFSATACDGMIAHEAEIPMVLMIEWAKQAGVGIFSEEMSFIVEKKLQDPQYANLLAAPGLRDPRVIIKGAR